MNLNDLSKFDLKNIDLGRVSVYLSTHADSLLRMGIVILMVFGGFRLVDDYLQQTTAFSVQITQMEEKSLQVMSYERSVSNLKSFWEKAPKSINDDTLVNYVTDVASKNHLDVLSFSPGQISADKFHTTNKVKFKLKAKEYKDFVLFVHNIENAGLALRTEAISCSLEQVTGIKGPTTVISIQMEIASVKINEQKDI